MNKVILLHLRLDSAEHWFRRVLSVNGLESNAYHGLLSLYKYKGNIDSTFKYSNLYDKALVDFMGQTKTTAISQAEGMYDYSRQQQMAQAQERRANSFKLALIAFLTIGFAIALRVRWIAGKSILH